MRDRLRQRHRLVELGLRAKTKWAWRRWSRVAPALKRSI